MRAPYLVSFAFLAAACGSEAPIGGPPDDEPDASTPDGGIVTVPPDAAAPDAMVVGEVVPPEVDGRLVINEVMADNALTIKDDSGVASDWVEIYNPTDRNISLAGYSLTDDLAMPRKAVLGQGVVVPARARALLWLDGMPEKGPRHIGFKLAREGGQLGLARPDGSYIDRVVYGAQAVDLSAAREPDGSDLWAIEWHATPGQANPGGSGKPVTAESMSLPPEQIPATGDLSERIHGYDEILQLELQIPPEGIAALTSKPYQYTRGTLVYEGRSYGPVGVRLKGQNSFQPITGKPSFRINIDEYVQGAKFFGLDDLTLNNMDDDRSMIHERIAYFVAREAGIPASRANHALITVNGQFYGLYTNLETVKVHMLARWFTDTTGPLYEATDVDFREALVPRYELESGTDDRSKLWGTTNALTLVSPDEAITSAGNYVNLTEFRRYWAMAAVVGQFDAFPYSDPGDDYFVYADPTSGRLWFLPWGMDETFYAGAFNVTEVKSTLAVRCKESAACFQAFVDETWDVLAMTEAMGLQAERERVAAQIAPYVTMDTKKPYTNEVVAQYQNLMKHFILDRRTKLSTMLPPPTP